MARSHPPTCRAGRKTREPGLAWELLLFLPLNYLVVPGMEQSPTPTSSPNPPPAPAPNLKTVFAGLMLGMFLGAVNQTIIAPAMPRIVAELGGMGHYSWIAVSSLLASTVIVPIVGKLSDLFGRKAFYVGGIVVFMLSSLVGGLAPTFEIFLLARVLEGFGMGTMMPLSQAILGDLVSPRDRGKYQGLMGATFGLASVVGPFLGGGITDAWGWRWLFFVNIPFGLIALGFIIPFMRLPHQRRRPVVDYAGFATLTVGLTAALLATTWGGTEYPWSSPVILGLYGLGAAALALFVRVESRAEEPVLPLRLWKNSIFTSANLANMAVAMAMFGAIYFIPVFVQGVLGASVTGSGAVLTPMMLSIVAVSTLTGLLVSKTGRYKLPVLIGIVSIGVGFFLLTRMDRSTTYAEVIRNMIFIGMGLGAGMQTFVLIVQNAVSREDLGVATATTQLFRSIGASVGTAVLGTIMTSRMAVEMARAMPAGGGSVPGLGAGGIGEGGAGAVLDPHLLAQLPPDVLERLRTALAAALHPVFVAALPFVGLAFVAALFIREIPLRRSLAPEEAGKELLAGLNQAGADDASPVLGRLSPEYRERTAFLGAVYALLAGTAGSPRSAREGGGDGHLGALIERIGRGDPAAGRDRLRSVARALLRECEDGDPAAGCADRTNGLRAEVGDVLVGLDPVAALERASAERPAGLPDRLRTLVAQETLKPGAVLTPADLQALERVGVILSAALLLDLEAPVPG